MNLLMRMVRSSRVLRFVGLIGSDSWIIQAVLAAGGRVYRTATAPTVVVVPATDKCESLQVRDSRWLTYSDVADVADQSRLTGIVRAASAALVTAVHGAAAARFAIGIAELDAVERTRLAGQVLIVAALSHAALSPLTGETTGVYGWIVHAAVAAAGGLALWRPRAIAAAWNVRIRRA